MKGERAGSESLGFEIQLQYVFGNPRKKAVNLNLNVYKVFRPSCKA
jgi:hypothetical protein